MNMIEEYIRLKDEKPTHLNTVIFDPEINIIDFRDHYRCVYCFEEAIFNLGMYTFKDVKLYTTNSREDYIEGNSVILPYTTCFDHLGKAIQSINPDCPMHLRDTQGKGIGQVYLIDQFIFLLDSFGNSKIYGHVAPHTGKHSSTHDPLTNGFC